MYDDTTLRSNRGAPLIRPTPRRAQLATVLALTVSLMSACAGDDGGSAAAPATGAPAAAPAPSPASTTSITVHGTAAAGAAIVAATVDLKCATGAASGTTAADGSYSIVVPGGVLPCMLRATPSIGAVLYSLALAAETTAHANLTPVTDLVIAQLGATDPATYYAAFSASVAAALTQARLASAEAAIVATLKAAGVDLTATADLISAPLVVQTGTTAGDAYDQALDLLAAAFTRSGTTLESLAASVSTAAAAAASPAVATATVALPAELLLQPAAATCASLRSSKYRVVTPVPDATLAAQSGLWTIQAPTLGVVRADGSTGTWVANGTCRFTDQGGAYSADVVVSAAGVLVGRYSSDNGKTFRNFIGLPEQVYPLADLSGTWNQMGISLGGSGFVGMAGSVTLTSAGVIGGGSTCENSTDWAVDTCLVPTAAELALLAPLQVDASGGFDLGDAATRTTTTRLFAYRSGGGSKMAVSVGDDGSFATWTPQATLVLPTVGTTVRSWDLDIFSTLSSSYATYELQTTVTSTDPATGSYLRTQGTIGQNDTIQSTLFVNSPRNGFVHRGAATVTGSDGRLATLNEFTALRLVGMGVSSVILPAPKQFEFAVTAP